MARASFDEARHGSVESYFGLVHSGALQPEDRVELLEGLVVAMAPQDPAHASAVGRVADALGVAIGDAAVIRVQAPLALRPRSVPEPDVAVVAGRRADFDHRHPESARLVVEVAMSSLPQDRLTKARIYAGAGIPEYWIVNLRDGCVEVLVEPDPGEKSYRRRSVRYPGERIAVGTLGGRDAVAVSDLLPEPPDGDLHDPAD